jgi:anti-sigma factor RsiW
MMSCQESRERLIDAVFGEVEDRDEALLNEHLAACESCRAEEVELLRLRARLEEPAAAVPEALEGRLRAALGAAPRPIAESAIVRPGANRLRGRGLRLRNWLRRPVPAYLAIAAVVVAVVLVRLLPEKRSSEQPVFSIPLRAEPAPQFAPAGAYETSTSSLAELAVRGSGGHERTGRDSL